MIWVLAGGAFLFLAAHLTPGVFGQREALVARLGEGRFLGIYIATSVTGMVGLLAGKWFAPFINVWYPPGWGRLAAIILVAGGFIMLATFALPSHIRRFTPHPMLWGIALWGVGHLLSNGDLASMIFFGTFAGYALIGIWSLNKRGAKPKPGPYYLWQDIAVLAMGLGTYLLIVWAHGFLFGVPLV